MSSTQQTNDTNLTYNDELGPRVIRLRPGAVLVEFSADQIQLVFPNHTVTFTSPPVTRGIRELVEVLKPGLEQAQAAKVVASKTSLEEKFIAYLIEMLIKTNCIYFVHLEETITPESQTLSEFYAYCGDDPRLINDVLSKVHPVIIVPDALQESLAARLVATGLSGEIVPIRTGEDPEKALKRVEAHLSEQIPLLMSWNFPHRLPFATLLNQLALRTDIPILFGSCEGLMGRIGPFVIPRGTACLECYNRRMLSNSSEQEIKAFQGLQIKYETLVPSIWPRHPVFFDAIESFFVLEAVQIALRMPPRTLSRVIEYNFLDSTVHHRSVHKVPRCSACGISKPPRLVWDVEMKTPTTKEGVE